MKVLIFFISFALIYLFGHNVGYREGYNRGHKIGKEMGEYHCERKNWDQFR